MIAISKVSPCGPGTQGLTDHALPTEVNVATNARCSRFEFDHEGGVVAQPGAAPVVGVRAGDRAQSLDEHVVETPAAAIVDQSDAGGLGAKQAWLYVTILTVGYMVSRGLAKSGSSQPYDEDRS